VARGTAASRGAGVTGAVTFTFDQIALGESLWEQYRPLACMDFEFDGLSVNRTTAAGIATNDERMAAFRRRTLRDGFQFYTLN
jgi:hypothetical protein